MTVPCTCRIPDPVVVNGQCLVCYGSREYTGPWPPPNDDPRPDDDTTALRERTRTDQGERPSTYPGALTERRPPTESDGGLVPGRRSS